MVTPRDCSIFLQASNSVLFNLEYFILSDDGVSGTCDHCDLLAVRKLQMLLFEKLSLAMQMNGRHKGVNIRNMQALKVQLIDTILNDYDTRDLRVYLYDQTEAASNRFIDNIIGGSNFSSKWKFQSIPVAVLNASDKRAVEDLFPLNERMGLSRAIIRLLDQQHRYHCGTPHCGRHCGFAIQRCPHPSCTENFSRSGWQQHDTICPFKIITCPQRCGELVVRRETLEHMTNSCTMRVVACPYQSIGCNPNSEC